MEELDIAAFLDRLKPYNLRPIERVVLGHTGTVQLLLSLLIDDPVDVKVLGQTTVDGVLMRDTSLVRRSDGQEVAHATSVIMIERNSKEVVADVQAGQLGIGQIAVKHKIPTERRIVVIEVKPASLGRSYTMEGPGLSYTITETFLRGLFGGPVTDRSSEHLRMTSNPSGTGANSGRAGVAGG